MGTFMDGDSFMNKIYPETGVIVLGNEANGISEGVEALVNTVFLFPDLEQ